MRSKWIVLAGSVVLAFLMVLLNVLFEVAGSVPDLPGCGFLAGGLGVLALLYPALACTTTYHFYRRFSFDSLARGGFLGAFGAAIYLGAGIGIALFRGRYEIASSNLSIWVVLYILLSFAGGFFGAVCARNACRRLAWVESEG
jgi:hypothetical protein